MSDPENPIPSPPPGSTPEGPPQPLPAPGPGAGPAYAPPAYAPAYPPAPGYNTLAIVGFILAFITGVGGIVCGHIALSQIRRTGEAGHGLALAATILGYVFTGLSVLYVIFIVVLVVIFAGAAGAAAH